MKTSELIKKLSELNYVCILENTKIIVLDEHGNKWVAINFYKDKFGTGISTFEDMYIPSPRFDALNIMMEYCRTEPEEREDEKKYLLKFPFNRFSYLNLNTVTGVYDMSNRYESSVFQTSFTQKEIDAMPFDTNFFIKEEV